MADKPKILLTRRWPTQAEEAIKQHFNVTLNKSDQPLTQEQLQQALRNHDAICPTVTDKLDAEVFNTDNIRTRLIANYGVGYNHIDIEAAKAKGLVVTNTPDVLTDATADLTLTLLLTIARRAGEGERQVRAGQWTGWRPTHLLGTQVSGKTLGIIGMGRIGRAVARRAHPGFGMRILFYNRSPVPEAITRAYGATRCETVEEVLQQSDFVSLHCPGGGENRHLINAERLKLMKPTAFLINTARGDVVDEATLIQALHQGTIAGAALDVYENEPAVPLELSSMENVVVLPHLGSATVETRVAMGMRVLENLKDFFDGKEPPDTIRN